MNKLSNPLHDLLISGLLDIDTTVNAYAPVVDLAKWSEDQCNQSLLFTQAVWNSIGLATQNQALIRELASQGPLMNLVTDIGDIQDEEGLEDIFDDLDIIPKEDAFQILDLGMRLDMAGKKYLVYMFMPCELDDAELMCVNAFDTFIIDESTGQWTYMEVHETPEGCCEPKYALKHSE